MNNKSNTYIACAYNSPKNLTYTKENECNILHLIEEQLSKFSESDQIIIGGDFNSRIGTKADFLTEDTKDLDFLTEGYELDTFTTHRNNERCLSKQLWRSIDSTLHCIEIKGTKR